MLKIFIKIMEAGIGFSLIVSLLIGYISELKYKKKYTVVSVSLVLGVIAAIVSSIVREIPNFVNRASLSFWSMVPIVISLIAILITIPFKEKHSIIKHIFMMSSGIYIVSSCFYYLPAIFVQLNNFVYYGESAVSTMVLYRIIGYSFGIVMMILSSLVVIKGIRKIKEKYRNFILIAGLVIWGFTQIFIILQRIYAVGFLGKNPTLFGIIAFFINKSNMINFVLMLFLLLVPILLYMYNRHVTESYNNPAELRKIRYHMKQKRNLAKFFVVVLILNVFSLTYLKSYSSRDIALSEPEEYEVVDGMIEIPLSVLEDMHLHRYNYTAEDGVKMRFFCIKKSQGSYGVVLDACDICGPSGYFERGDDVVCKLCDVVMNRGTIGFKGGCNPIPFPYIVHDEKIKIKPADLDALSHVFK